MRPCSEDVLATTPCAPQLSKGPITYRSPLRRTRISIKVEGFEPDHLSKAFPQHLQAHLTPHGKVVCNVSLWSGCVEIALNLYDCDDVAYSCHSQDSAPWSDMSGSQSDADSFSADACILQALLVSCQLPFQAGQTVWAQVADRQYVITCTSGGTEPAWSIQLHQLEFGDVPSVVPPMRVDASRLLFVAPMCVLLGDESLPAVPLQLQFGGRGLGDGALQFAALIAGQHVPCAHTAMDAATASSSLSAIDSWVQVHVPTLPALMHKAGLLNIECRAAASFTSPSLAGVLPVLLLRDPLMAAEVEQLQQEALQYVEEGAAASLSALQSLVTDLGDWLAWTQSRRDMMPAPAMTPGAAAMGDVARALLQDAQMRGWHHMAAQIADAMRELCIPLAEELVVASTLTAAAAGDETAGTSTAVVVAAASAGVQQQQRIPLATTEAAAAVVAERHHLPKSLRGTIVRAMLFGFQTAGDEARFVDYVTRRSLVPAHSWLSCCVLIFGIWLSVALARRLWNYLFFIIPFNSLPVLAAAWCCFRSPRLWRQHREAIWALCHAGRMVSRILLFWGNAAPSRAFMRRGGDIVAGIILPQSAERVRERFAVWIQLVDIVINSAVYHHIGLYGTALLPCLGHALVKTAIGVVMNVSIEYWNRRSFLLAMQHKRQ